MPISGCHDLPLATFNLPSRNSRQNKPQKNPLNQTKKSPARGRRGMRSSRTLLCVTGVSSTQGEGIKPPPHRQTGRKRSRSSGYCEEL